MSNALTIQNLTSPTSPVDVMLDTDAYNEIDDQFAIAYLLKKSEKLHVKGILAAPFSNHRAETPDEGMQKSYDEILKLLSLMGREELSSLVKRGSTAYLPDENTAVPSEAASFIAAEAEKYSPEKPLYIVAIGAITNVASAILLNPKVKENCVTVWLGGHARHFPNAASEFNMTQDIAAARVLFGCGMPVVQLPCMGVVDRFLTNKQELAYYLAGKNALCDYLYTNTCDYMDLFAKDRLWSKVIWDVTAVAWLLNEEDRFMVDRLSPAPIPEYDKQYALPEAIHLIKYVYLIKRDALFIDLFDTLSK